MSNRLPAAFMNRCETLATDWRVRLKRRAFDRLPADMLLGELQGEVITPDTWKHGSANAVAHLAQAQDWSGGILRLKPLLILLNPNHTPARYESDLMHELAHVLLNHPMAAFVPERGGWQRNPQHEQEAAYLGSCLQIPRRGMLWAKQCGFTVRQTAEHFGASEAMVQFRMNMTGARLTP